MSTAFNPQPLFADPADDWRWWFAWRLVRTLNYGWVWLRKVEWRPCIVHSYLDGPCAGTVFWQFRA